MNGETVLVALIIIGLIGRSSIVTTAACLLLALKLIRLERFFPLIERRGLELGLLFLTLAVLAPFASERVSAREIVRALTGWTGVAALVGGAIATWMNGKGLDLLQRDPQLIVGLVIGSIFGILFLRGIPVGPLMAAGIAALLLKLADSVLSRS
ncbi:MAG: hypothetical protein BLM47_04970 [Candidatus Reconcilbacillus cellulovorans]|uniref:UPF0756 membrane protein BLM47_04970 n=1 Tax=Candidatus Reconcilbacillus cellulovorans TaxID=1906605 RepID=A0A2A6E218_9BACL|nr:MAG: hypothetical protein BLM47_04970 [Candidatus Reconcilbacillus cellulovorans]